MATATTLSSFTSSLWGKKERTSEEKAAFQQEKVEALKLALQQDLEEIEQKLQTSNHGWENPQGWMVAVFAGGEFRGGEHLDDAYLLRWLRARYWKVEQAAQSIREHAKWRIAYCPELGRISTDVVRNELAVEKICLQGVDRLGRGFIIVRAARHSRLVRDADEVERVICYAMDRQLDVADTSINPERKGSVLFDLSDISTDAVDLTAMHQVNQMLSTHFVERLGVVFVFNAPIFFWAVWKGFSLVLAKESLEKIQFIYSSDMSSIHKDVPLDMLPEPYGGHAEYIPIQDYS